MNKSFLIISVTIITILLITGFLFVSCANKTPLTDSQKVYAGKWVASDGTYVRIYLDGGGDLEMSGTSVSGGAAKFKDGNLEIKLFGIGKTFKITKEPTQENNGWYMELDGIRYVKQ